MKATISGFKYFDEDGNGQRASTLIQGSPPRVVLVLDSSGSTSDLYAGDEPIPDLNGDNKAGTIIDGEIAASGELLAYLLKGGFGQSRLGLIDFNSTSRLLFDGKAEDQTAGSGAYDFYNQAKALQARGGTSYDAGLLKAEELIASWNEGPANIIFISDGKPNGGKGGVSTAERLTNAGNNIQAFGVGRSATINPLNAIDSDGSAYIFTRADALFDTLNGQLVGNVLGSVDYTEPGMSDIEIYIDINGNGAYDQDEPITKTDSSGNYTLNVDLPSFGTYEVREIEPSGYTQTEGNHWITFDTEDQIFEQLNFGNTKSKTPPPTPPTLLPYADFTPPYITSATINGNHISLTFNEEISNTEGLLDNDRFKVKINRKETAITEYTVETNKRQINLYIDKPVNHRAKATLGYKDSTNDQDEGVVQDISGNDMASFGKKKIKNITGSNTTLSINNAEADGRQIELTFTDALGRSIPKSNRFKIEVDGFKNKVKDIILGDDRTTATLFMQRKIELGSKIDFTYTDSPGDQARGVFQNELGEDLSTQNDLIINSGSTGGGKNPSLITSFGRFDEITMEFDEILKPGKIEPGLFQIKSTTSSYRVRQATVSKNSKQVQLELKDDLPSRVTDLTISYLDLPGDQRTGVIQSITGLDASTITASNIFAL